MQDKANFYLFLKFKLINDFANEILIKRQQTTLQIKNIDNNKRSFGKSNRNDLLKKLIMLKKKRNY